MGLLLASVLAPIAAAEPAESAPLGRPLRPLCPTCGATAIRIRVEALVVFDVVHTGSDGAPSDLEVIAHEWHDASWEADTPCACDTCGWVGRVADLPTTP
ncbi:hypothetical protein BH23DEI1_BH23DEI1_15730 [soil metagenome]